ncbi:ABC transporter substrate-binding protein [Rhizobacter sp. Root1221]|uniref:ABC transporter substrate-binding protein n=1 Tax=Rhizobacter sp. Root1221 TaxID=1736433 RepID=UPI0006F260C1|nr:ABC transporter substrate-binding protein [Rhizobacter sp. Root1221]KQV85945.1 amino acid ABC transporter substrate-binding protein [Rhizobacter sp. Root1221]
MKFILSGLLAALAIASPPASAEIYVGQTSGFTGPVAASVKELTEGARLYFDAVNAAGGVNGQKIELISLDDKFEPKLAAENARSLVVEKNVVALFLSRGTPHTEAIVPLLAQHKVPLVAPSTGAMVLHKPVNPYIFNVRATYQREAERAVRHLSLIGQDRIAILHADDSFGADVAIGADAGFMGVGKKPVLKIAFDRAKPDFSQAAPAVVKADAQSVMVIGTAAAVVDATKAIRALGSRATIVTVSNNASVGFIKQMGTNGHGTIVTQVFPYERSMSAPIVKEASDLARAKGFDGVSPAHMEGFSAAKVLVEGLKRAGPKPTRQGLMAALNTMQKVDLGGMELSFSPSDHTGLVYTDMSIISEDGKFRR